MRLLHITFQGGLDNGQLRFSEYYEKHFVTGSFRFRECSLRMLKLIQHLEQLVEAPPQWICTSHADLMLYDRDFADFGEAMDARALIIGNHHTKDGHYEIIRHAPKSENPWRFLVGTTADVKTACQIVAEALNKAPQG